jgi:hypothetical protein
MTDAEPQRPDTANVDHSMELARQNPAYPRLVRGARLSLCSTILGVASVVAAAITTALTHYSWTSQLALVGLIPALALRLGGFRSIRSALTSLQADIPGLSPDTAVQAARQDIAPRRWRGSAG